MGKVITITTPNKQSTNPNAPVYNSQGQAAGGTTLSNLSPYITVFALGIVLWLVIALARGDKTDKWAAVFVGALAVAWFTHPVINTSLVTVQGGLATLLGGGKVSAGG